MGAPEQLLLSEGVCRQINIIMYHKEFEVWCGQYRKELKPVVPTVRVNLTHAVKIPPLCQAMVPVKAHPPSGAGWKTPLYLEASDCSPCYCEDALLQPNGSGHTYMNVSIQLHYCRTWRRAHVWELLLLFQKLI